jgi:hypothetical protein
MQALHLKERLQNSKKVELLFTVHCKKEHMQSALLPAQAAQQQQQHQQQHHLLCG